MENIRVHIFETGSSLIYFKLRLYHDHKNEDQRYFDSLYGRPEMMLAKTVGYGTVVIKIPSQKVLSKKHPL